MKLSKRTRTTLAICAVTAAVAGAGFGASTAMADPGGTDDRKAEAKAGEDIELELSGANGYFNADDHTAYLQRNDAEFNPRLYVTITTGGEEDKQVLELTSMEDTNALPVKATSGTVIMRLCPTDKDGELTCTDWTKTKL